MQLTCRPLRGHETYFSCLFGLISNPPASNEVSYLPLRILCEYFFALNEFLHTSMSAQCFFVDMLCVLFCQAAAVSVFFLRFCLSPGCPVLCPLVFLVSVRGGFRYGLWHFFPRS